MQNVVNFDLYSLLFKIIIEHFMSVWAANGKLYLRPKIHHS